MCGIWGSEKPHVIVKRQIHPHMSGFCADFGLKNNSSAKQQLATQ